MASILSIVFPVFCAIAVGYAFGRFKKISLESLIEVLLYITIPSLVISSLTKRNFAISDVAVIAGAAVTVILGTGAISYVYLAIIKKRDLRGFYLPTMFMNSGNMSFPLALLAFGEEGLEHRGHILHNRKPSRVFARHIHRQRRRRVRRDVPSSSHIRLDNRARDKPNERYPS